MYICAFCGRTRSPITEEHIWPKWVSRILRQPGYGVDHFRHLKSIGNNTTDNWKGRYLDVTTETVCKACNNEWLSDFENDQVKRLAGPMLLGEFGLSLLPSGQAQLAAWAYKMALLLDVKMPDNDGGEFFTSTERLQFRHRTEAHPFTRVFLAKYDYGHHPAHAMTPRHTFTERDGEGRTFFLKISTITAGKLAMQVMSVRSAASGQLVPASELPFVFEDTARDKILSIWPIEAQIVGWPPSRVMNSQDLEDWTGMWINTAREPK